MSTLTERHTHHRTDLAHRNRIHDLISSVFLSELYNPAQCVDLLEDCKEECLKHGLSFSYILAQPIEPVGVSPLDFELLRCDPEKPELLLYLIDHFDGPSQRLDWAMRKACLRREYGGNEIYQQFSPLIQEHDIPALDLQHNFTKLDGLQGFVGQISISLYPSALRSITSATDLSPSLRGPSDNELPHSLNKLVVQFLVAKRAWRVVILDDTLKLILLDGPSADIDAHATVTRTTPRSPPELTAEDVDDDLNYADDSTLAESDAKHEVNKDAMDVDCDDAVEKPKSAADSIPPVMSEQNTQISRAETTLSFSPAHLHPLSEAGNHQTVVSLNLPKDDARDNKHGDPPLLTLLDLPLLLQGGSLTLQLTVNFRALPNTLSNTPPEYRPAYVEEGWDLVSDTNAGDHGPDDMAGWVKASWSGRDEDL